MSNLPLAFLMGFLGSLHCAVMCGPLMLSLPLQKTGWVKAVLQFVSYQIGRIFTYTLLGFLVGFIGNSFSVVTNQETLSLIIGLVLIVFTVLQFTSTYSKSLSKLQATLVKPIALLMGKLFGLPFWGFFAGLLNGLIPCGMVYLAMATALNTATIQGGGLFMLFFGLGTSPLMLAISLGGVYLKKHIRFNTQKLIPWFMLFMGTLFILRSAELGIPFFSPNVNNHPHTHVIECK